MLSGWSKMFKKITMRNYKGFEKAEVEIKPLTFLVGRNSSGKTSLIQLLLAFEQSRHFEANHPSQLVHNGRSVRLGRSETLWRNKDTSKELSLVFAFESDTLKNFLGVKKLQNFVSDSFSTLHSYLTIIRNLVSVVCPLRVVQP